MLNFDRFVGIDWSGAKSPIVNRSIAVSYADRGNDAPILLEHKWSRSNVSDWILEQAKGYERILIGIDCNFGYAYDVIQKQLGHGATYKQLWHAVDQACEHESNYFGAGFWENDKYKNHFWTSGKKRDDFLMPQRDVEIACAEEGLGHPESPFKLIGAKQVGKGGLSGMRMAHHLKNKLGDIIAFWPFERGCVDRAKIVVTEIYPRQFLIRAGHGLTKVRTIQELNKALLALKSNPFSQQQVFTDHDTDAILSAAGLRLLCGNDKNVSKDVSQPALMSYNAQIAEGWIFGITGKHK